MQCVAGYALHLARFEEDCVSGNWEEGVSGSQHMYDLWRVRLTLQNYWKKDLDEREVLVLNHIEATVYEGVLHYRVIPINVMRKFCRTICDTLVKAMRQPINSTAKGK